MAEDEPERESENDLLRNVDQERHDDHRPGERPEHKSECGKEIEAELPPDRRDDELEKEQPQAAREEKAAERRRAHPAISHDADADAGEEKEDGSAEMG